MAGTRKKARETAHHPQLRDSEQGVQSAVDLYYEHAVEEGWMFSATQARSREMCERILNAANAVFAKDGYEAAKIADIAQEADCSVGIFYKRFADKESMFCVLQYRHLAEARRQLGRLAEMMNSPLSTEEILYRFVRATVRYMLREPGYQRALIEISLKERRVWSAQQDHHRFAGDALIDFLVARNELPQPDEALRQRGRFAMRVIFGVVQTLMLVGPGPYDVKDPRVVDNLAEILRGFLREEQALSGHAVKRSVRKRNPRKSAP
jgi:AcrR family transcriptional regulator